MRSLTVAVMQMACTWDRADNIRRALAMVEAAARGGAQLVVLPELFETPYFCIVKDQRYCGQAMPAAANPAIAAMREAAHRWGVVIPVSFFERDGDRLFNSLAMIDANGEVLGVYRKSHIPDFPDYEEAFYFTPGDTGFRVFDTKAGRIGAAVCWDQWFPEAARAMALAGAEVLVYPTAIGRPMDPARSPFKNSKRHWQRAMQGHAACNVLPVAAANRIAVERIAEGATQFYGGSFIADHTGEIAAEAGETVEGATLHTLDLDAIAEYRAGWGVFRTRRPELYGALTAATKD